MTAYAFPIRSSERQGDHVPNEEADAARIEEKKEELRARIAAFIKENNR